MGKAVVVEFMVEDRERELHRFVFWVVSAFLEMKGGGKSKF